MAELSQVLTSHFTRYPSMQVQDIYKLLHQATLGSEHAIGDEQAARRWLERELTEMGDGPNEPLLDPLSADGNIVRVHMRPYRQVGKDPEILLKAFFRTANEWCGSPDKLKEYAAVAALWAQAATGSIQPEEIEAFIARMEAQGFPAVHHSIVFKRLYRPAYRVVARQFLEE